MALEIKQVFCSILLKGGAYQGVIPEIVPYCKT